MVNSKLSSTNQERIEIYVNLMSIDQNLLPKVIAEELLRQVQDRDGDDLVQELEAKKRVAIEKADYHRAEAYNCLTNALKNPEETKQILENEGPLRAKIELRKYEKFVNSMK